MYCLVSESVEISTGAGLRQALHSTSCLPVHPSIRREREMRAMVAAFLLDGGLRVLEEEEGGGQ